MVLQKTGKTRKLQGRRMEREEEETEVKREGTRTPLRAQTPQDLGCDVNMTPEPFFWPRLALTIASGS